MQDKLQTPYFLIHEELLSQNVDSYRKALDSLWPYSRISYSVKTNALPWILKWMNKKNVYAEVVSDDEYNLALLSGFSPDQIVFNGPIKGTECFRKALQKASVVNIDSERELEMLKNDNQRSTQRVGIRVNVDADFFSKEDVGYQEDGFRFGFSEGKGALKNAFNILQSISTDGRFGLHMHVNSITRSAKVYKKIAEYAAYIIKQYNLEPSYIDIGGGFFGGVPGKTTPDEYISVIKDALTGTVDPVKTCLIIEPGSALIGSAVELYSTVLDVKDTAHARIVTTDASRIYIDPLWLKNRYMFSSDAKKPPHPRQVICGYTCMDHDRLMAIENHPELSVGDHIVYHRVGNYTITFGGPFIRPYPPVYALTETGYELVRKAMTIEEYYRMETV